MTAKEMFEKLGYEYKETNDEDEIRYKSKSGAFIICFYKAMQQVYCYTKNDEPFGIDVNELQAINKQVEELGWK